MCNYKTWYTGNNGYILQCNACNTLQVCFGTTMLSINVESFNTLVLMVQKRCEALVPQDEDVKYIVIPTPGAQVHILLSESELYSFNEMLQCADNEIKAHQLFELLNAAG